MVIMNLQGWTEQPSSHCKCYRREDVWLRIYPNGHAKFSYVNQYGYMVGKGIHTLLTQELLDWHTKELQRTGILCANS